MISNLLFSSNLYSCSWIVRPQIKCYCNVVTHLEVIDKNWYFLLEFHSDPVLPHWVCTVVRPIEVHYHKYFGVAISWIASVVCYCNIVFLQYVAMVLWGLGSWRFTDERVKQYRRSISLRYTDHLSLYNNSHYLY